MGRSPVIVGIIAVVLFVTTAVYITGYVRSMQPAAAEVTKAPPPPPRVIVAASDLPVGTLLRARHLRAIDWPANALPPGSVTDDSAVLGSLTIGAFVANEPILTSKVVRAGDHTLLPLKIPGGHRAISLRVNDVTGISGFVAPGTRVDVIAVMDSGQNGRTAFTLLENIEVLAIAQQMDRGEAQPTLVKTVTLLVTPEQAERAALASSSGTLQLALRNYRDEDEAATRGVSMAELSIAETKKPGASVELIRGSARTLHAF